MNDRLRPFREDDSNRCTTRTAENPTDQGLRA